MWDWIKEKLGDISIQYRLGFAVYFTYLKQNHGKSNDWKD